MTEKKKRGRPKKQKVTYENIAAEIIKAGELSSELSWNKIVSRMKAYGDKITVVKDFHGQVGQIDALLSDDRTGIVNTILEFMISSATVPFTFVTDNNNLSNSLNDWSRNKLNKDIGIDIPVGLNELSSQYFRERWRSSFIVLNIVWGKVDDLTLPVRMFFSNGGAVEIKSNKNLINAKKYLIGETQLKNSDSKSVIIRKPYNQWYEDYPTPYLVKKGVLYNALMKNEVVKKQGQILEEIIPYLLLLRAGDKDLMNKHMLGDLDAQLSSLKDSLKEAKSGHKYRSGQGDTILKGRYDVSLEHFIPDLSKIFDTKIVKPINNDLLFGLGLVELEGFSSTRTEAILNPKVMIEEIVDGVKDLKLLYDDVMRMIIDRNKQLHPKQMNKVIRIIPGVIKPTLTDSVKKLVKDYANTGQLSLQDSFEALPLGFDFEINKMRREQERDNGDDDLFFPRVILNQNSDDAGGIAPRQNVTPQEVPKIDDEEASYKSIEDLPESIRNNMSSKLQKIFLEVQKERTKKDAMSVVEKVAEQNKNNKWVMKRKSSNASEQLIEDINLANALLKANISEKKDKLLSKLLKEDNNETV